MTIAELAQKIQQYIAQNTLTLPGDVLGSVALHKLIATHWPDQTLVIHNAQLTSSATSVTITGQMPFLSVAAMDTVAVFELAGSEVLLHLSARPPTTWRFSQSFPALQSTLFDEISFMAPELILTSCDQTQPSLAMAGINVQATVALEGPLAPFRWLLATSEPVSLGGVITFEHGEPRMTLHLQKQSVMSTGFLDLPLAIDLVTVPMQIYVDHDPETAIAAGRRWVAIPWIRIHSEVQLNGVNLPLTAYFSDTSDTLFVDADLQDLSLSALSDLAQLVNGADLGAALPADFVLGALTLTTLRLGIDLANKELQFVSCGVESTKAWTVIEDGITVDKIRVLFMVNDPAIAARRRITATVMGELDLDGVKLDIYTQFPDFTIRVALPQANVLPLSTIAGTFLEGIDLPAEIPHVEFSNVSAAITPKTGAFALRATAAIEWDFGTGGDTLTTYVNLALNRTLTPAHGQTQGSGKIDCTLNLHGQGPLAIVDELTLQRFDLAFALTPAKTWTLAGTVAVDLFDHAFNLAAAYKQAASGQTIQLATGFTTPTPLVQIAGVGGLSIGRLALELTRATRSSATANGATAKPTTSWQLTAGGGIQVEHVFDFAGALSLYQQADGAAGLIFRPTKAHVEIPLPVPEHESRVTVDFAGITLVRSAIPDSANATGAQWRFEAGATLALQGLPTPLQEILPDRLNATFQAGNSGIDLQVDRLTDPLSFQIPAIEINGQTIALGRATIDLTKLRIQLGAEIALAAQLGVGLPSELNKLFGVNEDGSAKLNFFRTYNPADPNNSVVKMQIDVGTAAASFTLLDSPIQAIHQAWEAGASWWLCDFGPYGKLKCQVPIFNYTGGGFQASGGLSIVEPLQLPLTPFKQLLTACNLAAAAKFLPDGVPIKEVKIVDDQDEFQVDALIGLLEGVGKLPDVVKDALQTVGDHLDQLPDAFTDYLNITLPDRLFYDIAISAGGSVKGSIRTYDPREKTRRRQNRCVCSTRRSSPAPAAFPYPASMAFNCAAFRLAHWPAARSSCSRLTPSLINLTSPPWLRRCSCPAPSRSPCPSPTRCCAA